MKTRHNNNQTLPIGAMILLAFFADDCHAINEMLSLTVGSVQPGGVAHANINLLNAEDMESFSLQLSFASGGILSLPASNWFGRGDFFPSWPFGPEPRVELNNSKESASRTKIFIDGFNPAGTSGAVGNVSLAVSGAINDTQIITLSGEYWSRAEQQVKTLSPVNAQFKVSNTADQLISFGAPPTVFVGSTGTVTATGGGSNNPVILSSKTTGICSIGGTTVYGIAVGTCTIAANQEGSTTYNPANETTQSFAINKGNQIITFGAAPTVFIGGTGTVTATGGTSGNPVTFNSTTPAVCTTSGTNGGTVNGVKAGTCAIAANQAGNDNYNPAQPVTQSLPITTGQTLTLTVTNLNKPGGTISGDLGGIACGATCSANVTNGTLVTLTAIPNSGYQFSGWNGACYDFGNTCKVKMDTAKSVTAKFEVFKRRRSPSWMKLFVR